MLDSLEPKFRDGFSDYPMESPGNLYDNFPSLAIENQSFSDNHLLCFSEAVIGGPTLLRHENVNPVSLSSSRSFMLTNWKLDDKSEFEDHLIVMFQETDGHLNSAGQLNINRGWINNHKEIEVAMKKQFGSHRFRLEYFTSLTGKELAELMLKTTVFISTAGGGSYSSLFLHKRAVLLLLDKIDRVDKINASIPVFEWDIKIFNHLSNLQLWRYKLDPSEYIDHEDFRHEILMRGFYDLNISKLISITERAMRYVELYNSKLKKNMITSYL